MKWADEEKDCASTWGDLSNRSIKSTTSKRKKKKLELNWQKSAEGIVPMYKGRPEHKAKMCAEGT